MIKKILITILLISCFRFVYCQDTLVSTENIVDTTEVYKAVDQMPQFPCGDGAMMKYINENLKYLEEMGCVQGSVILRFVVRKDGSITNIEIIRSLTKACDKEAIRLVESMPKWTPGEQNGKIVAIYYTLPVRFKLDYEK